MNKITPNFKAYIAECCIKEKYTGRYSAEDYYALAKFCEFENLNNNEHIKECFFKIQRLYINAAATNIVINSLKQEEQRMLFYLYKCDYNTMQLSYRLFTSSATLSRQKKEIISKIKKALFYEISQDDIYDRYKILGLINLIDYRLIHIIGTDAIQNPTDAFDKLFVEHLLSIRSKYVLLLQYIDKFINQHQEVDQDDSYTTCITYKLNHPHESNSMIAEKIGKSVCFVSQKLKEYKSNIKFLKV